MEEVLTRKQLYDLVWQVPFLTLSKKYNISDVGLRKTCMRLNIPVPKAGHWQKMKFGKKSPMTPLPNDKTVAQNVFLYLRDSNSEPIKGEVSALKILQLEIERSIPSFLKVPERLTNLDKLVVEAKNYLSTQRPDTWNYIGMVNTIGTELNTKVAVKNVPRALRFWDTLIKALKVRKHDVQVYYSATYVKIENHDFRILLREKSRKEIYREGNWDRTRYQPTGILSFNLDGYPRKEWKDSQVPVEEQISKIIAYLEIAGAKKKEDRIRFEKIEAERKQRERMKAEYLQMQKNDLLAFKEMLDKASRWHEANNLRNYISEVETRAVANNALDEKLQTWLVWAKQKADWYDPFIEGEDELLNDVNRASLEFNSSSPAFHN